MVFLSWLHHEVMCFFTASLSSKANNEGTFSRAASRREISSLVLLSLCFGL